MKQQQSLEIRWFFKGDRGRKHTLDWVRTIEADKNNPESTRTDFYLNNFYNGALGIKLRENQLEIKTRLEGLSQHDHKWNDKGRMEVYSKCEFDIAAKDQFSFEILHKKKHEKWIPLHKRRSLAKIKTNGSIKIYPGFIKIDDGCSVEITRLKLEDQNGWTFCVEAYSRKKDIYDNFQEAMHFISNTFKKSDEILKPELSMGYPSWLRSLFYNSF